MKAFLLICSLYIVPFTTYAQLNNGGIYALFGVDGDTRTGYAKYGVSQGMLNSDDWFFPSGNGISVIDTTNASVVKALLQASNNIAFTRRMNLPLYSKAGNKLWLDAVYGRDHVAVNTFIDSTAFTIACKNGDDPNIWVGGSTSFPNKNDLIDVFAHMRRDGVNVHDSLWLFTAVSTVGVSGSRYFDIELYKKPLNYKGGVFSTTGTEAGHSEWKFDAAGNIIQTGDLILAVNFTPGAPPVVDVRIWVSQNTFLTVNPNHFAFGINFNGNGTYGYASIVSKIGTTAFGAGISNYSATAAQDTTDATPWGTGGSTSWSMQYQSLQFVEMGLNLTRIGIDPALYSTLGITPCQSLFASIFFKSRSSNSFTSNMQDFVAPLDFLTFPVMDYTTTTDTLRCNKPTGTLVVNNNTTAGFYTWSTPNGNITGTSAFGNTVTINKPGTYIVNSAPASGCPISRTDTLIVPIDTFPPVATINYLITPDNQHFQFLGGDTIASNYMTPFGGSKGLLWSWSGPEGFTSTIQNPISSMNPGTYQLIVTEKRNGCKDTAVKTLSFFVLATNDFNLSATKLPSGVRVKWNIPQGKNYTSFEIEKSENGTNFKSIKLLKFGSDYNINSQSIQYLDQYPYSGISYYRIKGIEPNGVVQYSTIVSIKNTEFVTKWVVTQNGSNGLDVYTNSASINRVTIFAINGALLYNAQHQLNNGINHISLHGNILPNQELVICITNENNERYSQKLIYR